MLNKTRILVMTAIFFGFMQSEALANQHLYVIEISPSNGIDYTLSTHLNAYTKYKYHCDPNKVF
jgi:hypothetical protein